MVQKSLPSSVGWKFLFQKNWDGSRFTRSSRGRLQGAGADRSVGAEERVPAGVDVSVRARVRVNIRVIKRGTCPCTLCVAALNLWEQ